MPRLVRRRSLAERIKDYLNPHDWLMWISEEMESSDYPWDEWAYVAGAAFNFLFVLARANTSTKVDDGVFEDDISGGNFFGHLASLIVFLLTTISLTNALYTFLRKRHYRLFQSPVEGKPPATPSVHRVRIDSSPTSTSSPLRLLSSLLETPSASSRAHPDASQDVWELSVWDPTPLNLKLFCAFSPGHIFLYYVYLPVSASDPRPSATVATALALATLLTAHLALLCARFTQQEHDRAIVQREVLAEYNAKYVHPLAHPTVRDVGTQFDDEQHLLDAVDVGLPQVVLNRGFHTHGNAASSSYTGVDGTGAKRMNNLTTAKGGYTSEGIFAKQTPSQAATGSRVNALKTPGTRDSISPLQRATAARQNQQQQQQTTQTDEGHLGVYSHSRSPLKKSTSQQFGGTRQSLPSAAQPARHRTSYMSTGQGAGRSRYA